ncbi:hypothetical protein CGRA01v4_13197 [Colletotrichum graminicola]|nr:hypothetical protein CGRA01v4_13197 [Colletotrichum graminicola]
MHIYTTFAHPFGIISTAIGNCKYLLACIEEDLRMYSYSSQPHTRIVPAVGAIFDGKLLTKGTSISVTHCATSNSPAN